MQECIDQKLRETHGNYKGLIPMSGQHPQLIDARNYLVKQKISETAFKYIGVGVINS